MKKSNREPKIKVNDVSDSRDLTDEELLELFNVVDADGGGTIDREELKMVMVWEMVELSFFFG
jgi:Ca2+-binding EF-hand superfamily protein